VRFLVAGLLAVHGLLHILGVQWGKVVGVGWSAALSTLLVAAALRFVDNDRWWIVAAAGLVLSQGLIISAWSAARAGTLVNIVLAVPVIIAAAQAHFHHQSATLVSQLLARAETPAVAVVGAGDVAALPPPVRRWLESSGVVGRPRVRTVQLDQRGQLRSAASGPWLPARARQWFTVDPPGFVWTVDLTMKGLPVVGRDSYRDGHGRMLIEGAGFAKIVDGRGPQIDQGTLLRYLAELIWFPSAALASYVRWDPVDDTSARATMSYAGVTAAAVFTFDAEGRVQQISADRYLGSGDAATLERWSARVQAWRRLNGVVIPVEGVVGWKLKTGDFDYYRWQITRIEYDGGAAAPALRPSRPTTTATLDPRGT
jgi:hypothetical protein